ncbi:hypothetical protein F4808DRAFT_408694, partial [Astrocystis sublimbata]
MDTKDIESQHSLALVILLYHPKTRFLHARASNERLIVIATHGIFDALKSRCVRDDEHEWVNMCIAGAMRHMEQLRMLGRFP